VTLERLWLADGAPLRLSDRGFPPEAPDADGNGACGFPAARTLRQLEPVGCLVLLGEPGLGKSTALEQEQARLLRLAGALAEVLLVDAMACPDAGSLRTAILDSPEWKRSVARGAPLHLLLDGLDGSAVDTESVAAVLEAGAAELPPGKLRLRLTSRTAARRPALETQLERSFGPDQFAVRALLPLRRRDVRALAATRLPDVDAWLDQVTRLGLQSLAMNPATLVLLLDAAVDGRGTPRLREDAYEIGVARRPALAERAAAELMLCDHGGGRLRHRTAGEFRCARWLANGALGEQQVDDLLFTDTDTGPRVPDQLRGVAALLSDQRPDFAERLVRRDPAVRLHGDPATWRTAHRPVLVRALLAAVGSGRLRRFDAAVRIALPHLAHPGLAKQLRPLLRDRLADPRRRELAADVAGACEVQALERDLVALAVEQQAPQSVRQAAIDAIAAFASPAARRQLVGLAMAPVDGGDDVGHDLRAAALAATWPGVLPLSRLLASLDPGPGWGAYHEFLTCHLVARLDDAELAPALAWAASLPADADPAGGLAVIREQLLIRAAGRLRDDAAVVFAYARVVRRLLAEAELLSADARARHPDALGDPAGRRRLLEALMQPAPAEPALDADQLGTSTPPLARPEDLGWALRRLGACTGTPAERRWAHLVDVLLRQGADDDAVPEALEASSPELSRLAVRRRAGARLDAGPRAAAPSASRRLRPRRRPFDLRAKVAAAATELWDDGHVDGFWAALGWMEEVSRNPRRRSFVSDPRRLPGWPLVDAQVHAWLIAAAPRYLRSVAPDPQRWKLERSAWAGYLALHLLRDEDPQGLELLDDDVWRAWAPVIVSWPDRSEADAGFGRWAVAELVRRAPSRAAESLDRALSAPPAHRNGLDIVRRFAGSLVEPVQAVVLAHASDGRRPWEQRVELIDLLLAGGSARGWQLAQDLVAGDAGCATSGRRFAVHVAARMAAHARDAAWPLLWPLIEPGDGFGEELIRCLAAERQDRIHDRLTESELADLFAWLEIDLNGRTEPGGGRELARWREALLTSLAVRGTPDAVAAFERLRADFPGLRQLETLHADAVEAARRARRLAPSTAQLAALAADPGRRWLTSDAGLRRAVISALRAAEDELGADGAGAAGLGRWVATSLSRRLGAEGAVVGRDVRLNPAGAKRAPEALRVDAAAADADVISTVVAVAAPGGAGGAEVDVGRLERQLGAAPAAGVLLVGAAGTESASGLEAQADALNRRGLDVRTLVVDADASRQALDRRLLSAAGVALTLLLAVFVALSVDGAPRAIVAFAAMFLVPGAAITTAMPRIDPLTAVLASVVLSLAVDTAIALVLVWTGWWYPGAVVAVVLAGSCAVLIRDMWPLHVGSLSELPGASRVFGGHLAGKKHQLTHHRGA
jgi:hypothetical protein